MFNIFSHSVMEIKTLTEDQVSVPSTHMVTYMQSQFQFQGIRYTPSNATGTRHACGIHIYIQNTLMHKINKSDKEQQQRSILVFHLHPNQNGTVGKQGWLCWIGYVEWEILFQDWWERKVLQSLWTQTANNSPPQIPDIVLLGIYLKGFIYYDKDDCLSMLIAAVFTIARKFISSWMGNKNVVDYVIFL